jgi:hypothetical protein
MISYLMRSIGLVLFVVGVETAWVLILWWKEFSPSVDVAAGISVVDENLIKAEARRIVGDLCQKWTADRMGARPRRGGFSPGKLLDNGDGIA